MLLQTFLNEMIYYSTISHCLKVYAAIMNTCAHRERIVFQTSTSATARLIVRTMTMS